MTTCCSFANNNVKIIRYQDKNPSCYTADSLNKKLKKDMNEGIRLVLIMVKRDSSNF